MALTQKQEKFCQCVVSGMTYKDSYMAAYNCTSDTTAINEGSKLALREDIQKHLQALTIPLQQAAQQTALTEREKIKEKLWSIINDPGSNDSDKIRCCDVINRMNSEYINIQRIEKEETAIQDLDTQDLLKLVK